MIQAATQGNLADVEYALAGGAEINAKGIDNNGANALYEASRNNHLDVVRFLVEKCTKVKKAAI